MLGEFGEWELEVSSFCFFITEASVWNRSVRSAEDKQAKEDSHGTWPGQHGPYLVASSVCRGPERPASGGDVARTAGEGVALLADPDFRRQRSPLSCEGCAW